MTPLYCPDAGSRAAALEPGSEVCLLAGRYTEAFPRAEAYFVLNTAEIEEPSAVVMVTL